MKRKRPFVGSKQQRRVVEKKEASCLFCLFCFVCFVCFETMSQHARDESPSSSSSSEVQPPKKKARTTSPLSSAGQRNLSNSSNFANVLNSSDLFEDASGSEPSVGRDEIRSSGILFTSQTMRLSQNEDLSDRQFSALDLHSSARLQNATPTNPSSDSYFSSFLNTSMNTSMNAPASGQSNQFYNPSISGSLLFCF